MRYMYHFKECQVDSAFVEFITITCLTEDTPFWNLHSQHGTKNLSPALGPSSIRGFPMKYNKKLMFIVNFLLFLKTFPSRFGLSQQDKIGLEMSANLKL